MVATRGHTEVVRMLLAEAHVRPHTENDEALRGAAKNGRAAVVSLLLAGARVRAAAEDGVVQYYSL